MNLNNKGKLKVSSIVNNFIKENDEYIRDKFKLDKDELIINKRNNMIKTQNKEPEFRRSENCGHPNNLLYRYFSQKSYRTSLYRC